MYMHDPILVLISNYNMHMHNPNHLGGKLNIDVPYHGISRSSLYHLCEFLNKVARSAAIHSFPCMEKNE